MTISMYKASVPISCSPNQSVGLAGQGGGLRQTLASQGCLSRRRPAGR